MRYTYGNYIGKSERDRTLGRPRYRWRFDKCEVMDRIYLMQWFPNFSDHWFHKLIPSFSIPALPYRKHSSE
jgi:hypothetical protein